MKTIIITILVVFAGFANAQTKTESFKVSGNCNMCKERIEKAVNIKGVNSASWDVKTKVLTVKYNSSKITLAEIHKKIAAAGHDSPIEKADLKVYDSLHPCCQYERSVED